MKSFNRKNKFEICNFTPPLGGWGAILFLFFIFSSCIESLDINSNNIKPKIVLNGVIEADSAITVKISKTYPFTNDYYNNLNSNATGLTPEERRIPNLLAKANAKLFVNDEPKGNLRFVKNDSTRWQNGSIYQSSYSPKIGDKIRIEVSAPSFESVWAETTIPQPILINKVDTATFITEINKYWPTDGYEIPKDAQSLNLALGINIENPDKENPGYYSIEIFQEWIQHYSQDRYYDYDRGVWVTIPASSAVFKRNLKIIKDNEPLFYGKVEDEVLRFFLEDGNLQSQYHFTDKTFTDKRYTLNFSVWGYYFHMRYDPLYNGKPKLHQEPINIEIVSMSPELYQVDYKDYSEMGYYMHLFSEPKTTFTNVHNGVGILGSKSRSKYVINLPEYTGEY